MQHVVNYLNTGINFLNMGNKTFPIPHHVWSAICANTKTFGPINRVFSKKLVTTLKISSPVVVVESGWQNRKCSSISLLLANRICARSCEKLATSVDSSNCKLKNGDSFSFVTIWSLTSFHNSTILRWTVSLDKGSVLSFLEVSPPHTAFTIAKAAGLINVSAMQ